MIEVQGITKRYGPIVALDGISFQVKKGQIVGFLGANGAGKTTTMDILCGCIGADAGVARIAGYEISERPKEVKQRLGYLPDEPPLHNDMRVEDYIVYAARLRKVPHNEVSKRVNEIIDRLELQMVRSRLVGNLSKGFRQRVGLAQALVHNPEVLILDEPTEGLDPNQIIQIREMIRSLRGEHTIIFSSHILSEVENIADEIIIVNNGRVIEQGTYQSLVAKLEASGHYRLKVAQRSEALVKDLAGISGVVSPRLVDAAVHHIEFSVANEGTLIDQIARKVLDGGYGLRELAPEAKSLEDVFFQLTKTKSNPKLNAN